MDVRVGLYWYSPGLVLMTTIDDKINELLNSGKMIFEELNPRWKLAICRVTIKAFFHMFIITELLRRRVYLGWYLFCYLSPAPTSSTNLGIYISAPAPRNGKPVTEANAMTVVKSIRCYNRQTTDQQFKCIQNYVGGPRSGTRSYGLCEFRGSINILTSDHIKLAITLVEVPSHSVEFSLIVSSL